MKLKSLLLTLITVLTAGAAYGQDIVSAESKVKNHVHMDLSVTGGSTGIGLELGLPINEFVTVRAGATYMPEFHKTLRCRAQLGENEVTTYDEDGNPLPSRFQKMANLLEGFVGTTVDEIVAMDVSPSLNQAKLLVDVSPFKDKRWHFTTGFYLGQTNIATAINQTGETGTMMAINLYNRLYENDGEIADGFSLPPVYLRKLYEYGRAGIHMGNYTHDITATDPTTGETYVAHQAGDPYMMVPCDDNTVYAKANVNKFRPYFGIGFAGYVGKKHDWKMGFDIGSIFWGGAPKLIDHSGVDLMYDVEDVGGNVGDYIKLARHLKAYPVLELKISRRLF